MAGRGWIHGDIRRQQQPASLFPELGKRQRVEYEMPSGSHMSGYYARANERSVYGVTRDTASVNALYERYLRNAPILPYGAQTGRSIGGPDGVHEINDLRVLGLGRSNPTAQSRFSAVCGLPGTARLTDATTTLFVEGLPANCTRREVSHIFRPFVGYKEVRIVMKNARRVGDDPFVLCFVDFDSPAHAAVVKDALQGYIFDENNRDSNHLRLQFSRNPGARSGLKNVWSH